MFPRKHLRSGDAKRIEADGNGAVVADPVPEDVSAETPRSRPTLPPGWDAAAESVSAGTPPRSASQRRAFVMVAVAFRAVIVPAMCRPITSSGYR